MTNLTGKIHIGISVYNACLDHKYLSLLSNQLKNLNILIKDNLRESGKKVGFLKVKGRRLSSVAVYKNRLLDRGVEIVLVISKERIFIGKTKSVQEFESFGFRDIRRPRRDKKSGIMPPKLARIMLNLARPKREGFLLDPFCGSGTILQEAIVLGYKNIIGSDVSQKAVSDTRRNINWLFKKYGQFNKTKYNIKIFQADVRDLSGKTISDTVEMIVTEPFLGPPLHKKPKYSKIKRIFFTLEPLYLKAFTQFQKVLAKNGIVVIIFPVFERRGKFFFLDLIKEIRKKGFKLKTPIPEKFLKKSFFDLTERKTMIYGNRYYYLMREILIFEKI